MIFRAIIQFPEIPETSLLPHSGTLAQTTKEEFKKNNKPYYKQHKVPLACDSQEYMHLYGQTFALFNEKQTNTSE